VTRPASRRPPVADEIVGAVVGRYQLLHRLASGGMGTVYAARATGVGGFERLVAVKVLHPHLAEHDRFVSMFLDEARLAARIHHPNVVATLDVFEEGGRFFLVMDYVRGMELGALLGRALSRKIRVPAPIVVRVIVDALAGLSAAHQLTTKDGRPLGLVHRDVSPQNILVGADGIARLTDFGVAKAEERLSYTRGNAFKGKLSYASPEQIEHSICDQRSDLFSTGVVLWEALTHRRLFKGDDKFSVMRAVTGGEILPLGSFDPTFGAFDRVVAHALARDPERRVASADVMIREVEEAAAATGLATPTQVAEWVRSLGSEQIEQEAEAIRVAEATIGGGAEGKAGAPDTVAESPRSRPPVSGSGPHVPAAERADDAISHEAPIGVSASAARERREATAAPSGFAGSTPPPATDPGASRWLPLAAVALALACILLAGVVVLLVLREPDEAPATEPAPAMGPPSAEAPATGPTADPPVAEPEERPDEVAEPAEEGEERAGEAPPQEGPAAASDQGETSRPARPRRTRPTRMAPPRMEPAMENVPDNPYRNL